MQPQVHFKTFFFCLFSKESALIIKKLAGDGKPNNEANISVIVPVTLADDSCHVVCSN